MTVEIWTLISHDPCHKVCVSLPSRNDGEIFVLPHCPTGLGVRAHLHLKADVATADVVNLLANSVTQDLWGS